MLRKWFPELIIAAGLLVLPLLLFFPVTLGGKTQIPADNLYEIEPWSSAREALGVPEIPHNALLSDLILENYQWKSFLRQSIRDGVIPLWQPNQFAGTPFLAAGQHSALYPFSVLYYVLPLWLAYGWFTVSQLWLAGVLMMLFARGLGVGRLGAAVAGVAYQLSAFFVISAVFPMMIAGAAWLPLLLLMVEFVIRRRPLRGERPAVMPWIALGAVALMMNVFAGHVEITYYTLIVMAYYAAARLLWQWWRQRRAWKRLMSTAGALLAMVALGMGLGAAQFVPLYELGTHSFRESAAGFDEVRSWGLPARHVAKFLMPNAYGNPAQHSYVDVFEWQRVPLDWVNGDDPRYDRVTNTDFGIKNYVEGGVYMGILVMALAAIGLIAPRRKSPNPLTPSPFGDGEGEQSPPIRAILAILGGISLTFAFGLPTYAVIYYLFPNLNQLHTPFRWVWPLTFVVAALAGFGADALTRARRDPRAWRVATWVGGGLLAAGALILLGLAISRIAFGTVEPLVEDVYTGLAKASSAFPNARAFYSYEFWNVLYLGLATAAAGGVILLSRARWTLPGRLRTVPLWQPLAVAVIAVDLLAAGWNFNSAADPDWLDYTPPSVAWLQDKMAAEGPFRYTTIDQGEHPLHANSTWQYGLQDVRGYDSLIPRQYADYMRLIAPQGGLAYNRIDPIHWDDKDALASPLLDLLNVRYVVSDWFLDPDGNADVDAARAEELGYALVYDDGTVRIYENLDALPRAYTLPYTDLTEELCASAPDDFSTIVQSPDFTADPRRVVIEGFPGSSGCDVAYDWPTAAQEADPEPATITAYGSIEVTVEAAVDQESWLVLADSYYPGWKAFVRPQGAADDQEEEVEIRLVDGNFRGVRLEPGAWTVRFRYSPATFQVGAFGSFLSGMLVIFLLILWLWRRIYREDGEADSAKRIAKNSLAPIVLNLFNRGIDLAFAFIMLRILGPANAGVYYYAIVIFGWFDILTNFGLNTFLTREVARDRDRAGRYLLNTTALRLGLALLGIPLLAAFFVIRNQTVSEPLEAQAVVAIVLLYVALLPGSISTGLTALFYAFEKAEFPAAITTISTIAKVTIGLATLLLGWGVEGLAGGAIATNLITFVILAWLARPLIRGQFWQRPDRTLMRHMMGESWPLMINHLLATVFFKIDVVLMEAINGNVVVGQYSTAYKWLDALNIIPAFLTMALLPVMARQAHEDRAGLKRNYTLAVKLLLMVALPVAVITTFIAEPLVHFLGGAEYLPAGAVALQLMIWSILIGWMNSVTNYVIVALDRQRTLTFAFVAGVVFNLTANILLLPAYSYRAAAIITIFSEGVLFAGFYWIIRQELGAMGWGHMLGRLAVAGIVLAAITWGLWSVAPLLALAVSPVVYGVMLFALRPFLPEELARIAPLLPGPLRRRIAVGS
ncbi:flippase [Aggregatilinea lenta]|uniref:flippase n=1 Tax=Aggregatilinea lenta TaxID=913108 RepID=UPI000E5BEADB|nr:oligosaccharide flippase family protein [Aggregatilinea lenta]